MEINQRISAIIDLMEKGKQNAFASKTGIPTTTLSGIVGVRQSDPSSKILNCILKGYPDVSPEWLLTGRGNNLRSLSGNEAILSEQPADWSNCPICKEKEKRIEDLKETIAILRAQVNAPVAEDSTKRITA